MGGNASARVAKEGMRPLNSSAAVPAANPLHVHTIADSSGEQEYLPGVRKFLNFCADHHPAVETDAQKDAALADALAWHCYYHDELVSQGKAMFNGVLWIWPELSGKLPLARRAMKGWERFEVTGECKTSVWELVFAIAQCLEDMGEKEAADIVELSADLYLREAEWAAARPEEVVQAPEGFGASLLVGRGDRGEAAKAGTQQGVRADREGASRKLLHYKKLAAKQSRKYLFSLRPSQFYALWNKACRRLRIDPGPPHSLRHCGSSFDLLEQGAKSKPYRTLGQVQTRGRWAAEKSVLRYGKTFFYLKSLWRTFRPSWSATAPAERGFWAAVASRQEIEMILIGSEQET